MTVWQSLRILVQIHVCEQFKMVSTFLFHVILGDIKYTMFQLNEESLKNVFLFYHFDYCFQWRMCWSLWELISLLDSCPGSNNKISNSWPLNLKVFSRHLFYLHNLSFADLLLFKQKSCFQDVHLGQENKTAT